MTFQHHAMVVTSSDREAIEKAREVAVDLGLCVSAVTSPTRNNVQSFFVPPDGALDGSAPSDDADHRRDLFTDWLDAQRRPDGTSPYQWVEVTYGERFAVTGWPDGGAGLRLVDGKVVP